MMEMTGRRWIATQSQRRRSRNLIYGHFELLYHQPHFAWNGRHTDVLRPDWET